MLAEDVKIIDISPEQLKNLNDFLLRGKREQQKGIIIFYELNKVIRAVHTKYGPIKNFEFHGAKNLKQIQIRENVDYVIALQTRVLRRIASSAQTKIKYDTPFLLQLLAIIESVKNEIDTGIFIYPYPNNLALINKLSLLKTLKFLLPQNFLVSLFTLEKENDMWFSLILKFENSEISLLTTSDAFASTLSEIVPHDLKNKHIEEIANFYNSILKKEFGQPTISIYMVKSVFCYLISANNPLYTLSELYKNNLLIISPCPIWFKLLIYFLHLFNVKF